MRDDGIGSSGYCGRFAPSPTGPLHFGSLVTALGSCLEARCRGGKWHLRVDDLDPPREMTGAAASILRSLERLGFEWDGPVVYQSTRSAAYAEAIDRLVARGAAYPCSCTRSDLRDLAAGDVYPGTCRGGVRRRGRRTALRVLTGPGPIRFRDRVQGDIRQSVAGSIGDFVVRRRDGLFAYHLAVVVDDAAQGISDVVRGADLLDYTPPQIHLQHLLGLPTPAYAHLPVVTTPHGEKLSKQTGARPIDEREPREALRDALAFLGHAPPGALRGAGVVEIWGWALENWQLCAVPVARRRQDSAEV